MSLATSRGCASSQHQKSKSTYILTLSPVAEPAVRLATAHNAAITRLLAGNLFSTAKIMCSKSGRLPYPILGTIETPQLVTIETLDCPEGFPSGTRRSASIAYNIKVLASVVSGAHWRADRHVGVLASLWTARCFNASVRSSLEIAYLSKTRCP